MMKLLIFLLISSVYAATTVVQHKQNGVTTNGVTVPITVTSTGAGNLLVVGTVNNSSRNVTGVSDGTNNFTQATNAKGTSAAAGTFTDIWYLLSSQASKVTITITFSGAAGTFKKEGFFWEVSGLSNPTFDLANHTTNATDSAGTTTGASITTTGTSEFAVGAYGSDNGVSQNPKTGNEFTSGGDIGTFGEMAGNSLITSVVGAHQPVWLDANPADFASSTAGFKSGSKVRHRVNIYYE